MSTSDPSGKQGTSPWAIIGVGCGVIALILCVGAFVLLSKGCSMAKEYAAEYQKNPAKATALLMLKANPDYELVSTDDTKSEITIKQKSNGEELTLSFEDIANGKFTMKNSKGEVVTMEGDKNGQMTIKGPNGSTTIGGNGAATAPPAWVPSYAGATTEGGGVRMEEGDKISGTYTALSTDSVVQVKEALESKLKAEGFTTTVTTSNTEGKETAVISAKKDDTKQTVNIIIAPDDQKTSVVTTYEGTK